MNGKKISQIFVGFFGQDSLLFYFKFNFSKAVPTDF